MTDPVIRPKRRRRPPEAIAAEKAEKARRKAEREQKRAERLEAAQRKQAAREAEAAKRAKMGEVVGRRSKAASATGNQEALAVEEAGLAQRRKLQARNARELRRRLAQAGVDPDAVITEQSLAHAIVIQGRKGSPTRMERRGPAHDPRLKLDARLIEAAQTLERWAAEAARLGSSRNPLAAWVEDGGVRGGVSDGDPDAARSRVLAARKRLNQALEQISNEKVLKTPAGDRSARDALRLCVIEGWPIAALAAAEGGRRFQAARRLLAQSLEDLADIIDPPRRAAA